MIRVVRFLFLFIFFGTVPFGQDFSIKFDGQNDYILISDNSFLDLTQDYTLEAWIFPETFSWLGGIISKYHTNAANGYLLRLTHQSPYTGLGFDELVTSTGLLESNQWSHIAAVKQGQNRKIFINGLEYPLSGSSLNVVANNNPIRIGSDYGGRYFDGRIDEVRIWNIARLQTEIISTIDTSLSGAEPGLVAYYNFNDGFGDTILDQTDNGLHGTLYGNPSWVDGYTLSGMLGDVNFDEILNVYDAVMLVAIMLMNESGTNLQLNACDTNQDGVVNIEDIVLLFQWILDIDPNSRSPLRKGQYIITDNSISIVSQGAIAGFQLSFHDLHSLQEIDLPLGWSWNKNDEQLIAYSTDGSELPADFSMSLPNPDNIKSLKLVGWGNAIAEAKATILPASFNIRSMPNPFNPGCTITFNNSSTKNISIDTYNTNGQFLENIADKIFQEGNHQIYWEPNKFASGIYCIRISNNQATQFHKVLYLK